MKNWAILFLIFVSSMFIGNAGAQSTSCPGDGSATDLACGLVGHWTFDDGSGTTATDSSGNGNNGTLVNGATWTTGAIQGAVHLNGVNQYVQMNTNLGSLSSFTLTAFINLDASAANQSQGDNPFWALDSHNVIVMRPTGYYITIPDSFPGLQNSTASNIGLWVHVAIVRTASTISYYRDGVLVQTANLSNAPSTNFSSFVLGSWSGYQFSGAIDDLRLYNRALTDGSVNPSDNEIASLASVIDVTPPSVPTGFSAFGVSETQINLAWTASTDNVAVAGYKIYRDSGSGFVQIGVSNTNSYSDSQGLAVGTVYNYQISAFDAAGNISGFSTAASASPVQSVCVGQTNRICTAVTGNVADVQSAIDQSLPGDTVVVPAGNWIWTTAVNLNKAVTFEGVGIGQTVVVDNTPVTGSFAFNITVNPGGLTRVTNMTFEGGTIGPDLYNDSTITITGTSKQWRIDDVRVHLTRKAGIYVYASGGVIDHSTFDFSGWYVGIYGYNGDGAWGDLSWAEPSNLGSNQAFYVEDNLFEVIPRPSSTGEAIAIDGWIGERVVFRHNILYNMVMSNHGTESSGRSRGARTYEFYDNTFQYDAGYTSDAIAIRSGTGVIFDNTVTGNYQNITRVSNYRDFAPFDPWGQCDGTGPFDVNDGITYDSGTYTSSVSNNVSPITGTAVLTSVGKNWTLNQWVGYTVWNTTTGKRSIIVSNTQNTITATTDDSFNNEHLYWDPGDGFSIMKAWVCIDQVGRGQGVSLSNYAPTPVGWPNQAQEPTYIWGNTLNGALDTPSSDSHIQVGRDIYVNTPVTCDAVNQTYTFTYNEADTKGNLTGNTKTWVYTPYPYPHPLTGLSVVPITCSGPSTPVYGDVNGDGSITIADAELVAQSVVGLKTLTTAQQTAAEVDGKNSVDIYDAFLIAEYVLGQISKFPAG